MQAVRQTVGANVATYRELAGISQAELASRLAAAMGKDRMDPTTITRMESGKRPTTVDEIAALATVFEIDSTALLAPSEDALTYFALRSAVDRLKTASQQRDSAEERIAQSLREVNSILEATPNLRFRLKPAEVDLIDRLRAPF
ncbi:helix-turn-helix domain-containing protein [Rhodococcoides corynebacterioides]|uniref:helix-turn-helix domain-containing protein n=1 Tax=Rhodococcoides corynebacterioides TaxID=53972 RepID=UPI0027E0EC71|nr:helix-turn-helix transcriptional regulator [Rhodococcus corynebacterioides]